MHPYVYELNQKYAKAGLTFYEGEKNGEHGVWICGEDFKREYFMPVSTWESLDNKWWRAGAGVAVELHLEKRGLGSRIGGVHAK